MEIDARMRKRVHTRFEELMGPEMADAVMEMFPPAGWRGVATKDDVDRLGAELRGEIARSEGRLRGEVGRLQGEIAELRGEVRGDVAELRGQLALSEGRMSEELGKLHSRISRMYVVNFLSMVGVGGLVLTALLG